jgi:hypothetical protein
MRIILIYKEYFYGWDSKACGVIEWIVVRLKK